MTRSYSVYFSCIKRNIIQVTIWSGLQVSNSTTKILGKDYITKLFVTVGSFIYLAYLEGVVPFCFHSIQNDKFYNYLYLLPTYHFRIVYQICLSTEILMHSGVAEIVPPGSKHRKCIPSQNWRPSTYLWVLGNR
jgi:hypothetical protein